MFRTSNTQKVPLFILCIRWSRPEGRGQGTVCGGKHKASDCHCKSLVCYKCGKKGHLVRVCRSHGGVGNKGTRSDGHSDEQSGKTPMDGEETETYALYNLSSSPEYLWYSC